MGVNAKLYLSHRWSLNDVVEILERTQMTKVKVEAVDPVSPGFYTLSLEDERINFFYEGYTPIGPALELMARSTPGIIEAFKDIAKVLGGILQPTDSFEEYEFIDGAMWEEDGLPYFIRHAIISDGIDPIDLSAFLESKKNWHKRYERKEDKEV